MNDLSVDYQRFIGNQLFCIKGDKTYGITKGNSYKVIDIKEKSDKFYAVVSTDKGDFGFGINQTIYFLGLKESLMKLRELKLKRALGEDLDS